MKDYSWLNCLFQHKSFEIYARLMWLQSGYSLRPMSKHLKIMGWGKINSPIINKSLLEVYMEELTSI